MDLVADLYTTIQTFLERGGGVLLVIALVILAMWTLILSRWLYLRVDYRWDLHEALARHPTCSTKYGGYARQAALLHLDGRLNAGIPVIKALAQLCPLLGLLGTVVGMIHVFDMLVALGTSSSRSVASGVSIAMVTTMAGMVGALSGIFPAVALRRRALARMHDLQSGEPLSLAIGRLPAHRPKWNGNLRRALAPLGALIVTLGLLFSMEQTIVLGRTALSEATRSFAVDFIRVARNDKIETRQEKPDRPDAPPERPDTLSDPLDPDDAMKGSGLLVAVPQLQMQAGSSRARVTTGFMGTSDGDYLPLVKVAPVYPYRAELRHLEGWVLVRFTVMTSGLVKDIEIVESSDKIFEAAAAEAAAKFKYRPRIVNGESIEVHGVLNRITFTLQH